MCCAFSVLFLQQELDVKAGGGHNVTIGDMLRQWMTKLEWYSTLFPRIPVPIQKVGLMQHPGTGFFEVANICY